MATINFTSKTPAVYKKNQRAVSNFEITRLNDKILL